MSERLTPEESERLRKHFAETHNDCAWQITLRLLAEIDRLREDNKALLMTIELLREGWDEAIAENKALREALEWYTDDRKYGMDSFTNGAIARAALERTR